MDAMMRNLVVKRDILTVSPPCEKVRLEMISGYYDEEPHGIKRYPHCETSSSGMGVEMKNGCYDEEPCGKGRYPHREFSLSRG